MDDIKSFYMRHALELAQHQLGQTWPNPAVGAVIVKQGKIIAEGATAKGGRPHAETIALAQAGKNARGATLYVTLEPCAHYGKTPPCVDAIIASGIATVVMACKDPDERTAGKSITKLRQAGIKVELGEGESDAMHLNRGFFSRIQKHRPHIMLKLATSKNGCISLGDGNTRWVTSEASRKLVHQYRAHYDALLTTINTVEADNPVLTCRLPGIKNRSPVRIVLDRHLRISPTSKLIQTANEVPLWVITESTKTLDFSGVNVYSLPNSTLRGVMEFLADQGLTRVMVEAGAKFPLQLFQADVVDEICWFRSPNNLQEGRDVVFQPVLTHLKNWNLQQRERVGEDTLEIYTKP